jgi:hypothetical protein
VSVLQSTVAVEPGTVQVAILVPIPVLIPEYNKAVGFDFDQRPQPLHVTFFTSYCNHYRHTRTPDACGRYCIIVATVGDDRYINH